MKGIIETFLTYWKSGDVLNKLKLKGFGDQMYPNIIFTLFVLPNLIICFFRKPNSLNWIGGYLRRFSLFGYNVTLLFQPSDHKNYNLWSNQNVCKVLISFLAIY